MQEMFTKDLEELKNKQTDIVNTLEGINSRITKAEEQINNLEDRMLEITAAEYRKKKKDSLIDLCDNVKHTIICIMGSQKEKRERPEKIFEYIIDKTSLAGGKEIVNQVQEAQSPKKDKPKEEHTETHGHQTDKI